MKKQAALVGRVEEIQFLETALQSHTAEFVAVYGRRRVGKTYLVKTVFQQKKVVFFHITGMKDAPMAEQIDNFVRVIETTFYSAELEMRRPESWKKTFELLTYVIKRLPPNQKCVLFFDELPWLASKRSRFIQALDYYWNRHWSDMPQVKLIICGSAASWMIDNIISNKGGLHNRISGKIHLAPFSLKETKVFLLTRGCKCTDAQILDIYMVTGGIPYYLHFIKKQLSAPQNIDALCFQNKGELVTEFSRLYASLFHHSESYEELIRIIASKRTGIERSEILKKSKYSTDGGRLKARLNALEQSDFIVSFNPYGFVKRKTFYRMIDEYSLFYLNWIEPAFSHIKKLDKTKGFWLEKCQLPAWRSWSGYAFESVCYKHIAEIRQALSIRASAYVGSWQYIPKSGSQDTGAQIDLLFDREDGVITVCEMKYTTHSYQFTKEEAHLFMRKIESFKSRTKTAKQIQVVFITNIPIKPTLYSEELITQNVVLKDII